MLKAMERALFIAESDTRKRKSAPVLREIEARLIKNILAQSLALQIIKSSRKPSSELLADLLHIEAQVGEFVGIALEKAGGQPGKIDFKGVLAGALSFIPMKTFTRRSAKMLLRKAALNALDRVLPDKPLSPGSRLTTMPPQLNNLAQMHPPPEKATRIQGKSSERKAAKRRPKSKASARAPKPSVRKKAK